MLRPDCVFPSIPTLSVLQGFLLPWFNMLIAHSGSKFWHRLELRGKKLFVWMAYVTYYMVYSGVG